MIGNSRNGTVRLGLTEMSYVSFGHGKKTLAVLPGLSDGLATVKGKALLLSAPYKRFFDKFTVYMFSRKNDMPDGYSLRDMAADQAAALKALSIEKTSVLGVSQGGAIAQYLAADAPGLVEKLVLTVTAPYTNDTLKQCLTHWISLARTGDHKALMIDTAERSYSPTYLKKYRRIYPFIGLICRQKSYRRFLINANAILNFSTLDELHTISCPTLIIGGEEDKIVGTSAATELHENIRHNDMYIYNGLGHALYEEAPDFYERVLTFLEK